MGSSCTVIIRGGVDARQMAGIYFCEFDGPRNREFYKNNRGLIEE